MSSNKGNVFLKTHVGQTKVSSHCSGATSVIYQLLACLCLTLDVEKKEIQQHNILQILNFLNHNRCWILRTLIFTSS